MASGEVVSGGSGDLARLDAALDEILAVGVRSWAWTDAETRDRLEHVTAAVSRLEAARLAAVRELGARPDAVAGTRVGEGARAILIHRLRISPAQARRDVDAAAAIDPQTGSLPQLGSTGPHGARQGARISGPVP